jgi:hypothetical protein
VGEAKQRTKTFFCQDYLTIDDSIYTTIQEICKGRYPKLIGQNKMILKKKKKKRGRRMARKYQKENVSASKSS